MSIRLETQQQTETLASFILLAKKKKDIYIPFRGNDDVFYFKVSFAEITQQLCRLEAYNIQVDEYTHSLYIINFTAGKK